MPILRSGQLVGDATIAFGQQVDDRLTPLTAADGSKAIADSNDFTSLLSVHGKLFSASPVPATPPYPPPPPISRAQARSLYAAAC